MASLISDLIWPEGGLAHWQPREQFPNPLPCSSNSLDECALSTLLWVSIGDTIHVPPLKRKPELGSSYKGQLMSCVVLFIAFFTSYAISRLESHLFGLANDTIFTYSNAVLRGNTPSIDLPQCLICLRHKNFKFLNEIFHTHCLSYRSKSLKICALSTASKSPSVFTQHPSKKDSSIWSPVFEPMISIFFHANEV